MERTFLQGPHQVAQTSMSIGLPAYSARVVSFPSRSTSGTVNMPWATVVELLAGSAIGIEAAAVPGSAHSEPVTIETMEAQVEQAPVVPITATYPVATAGMTAIAITVLRIGIDQTPEERKPYLSRIVGSTRERTWEIRTWQAMSALTPSRSMGGVRIADIVRIWILDRHFRRLPIRFPGLGEFGSTPAEPSLIVWRSPRVAPVAGR